MSLTCHGTYPQPLITVGLPACAGGGMGGPLTIPAPGDSEQDCLTCLQQGSAPFPTSALLYAQDRDLLPIGPWTLPYSAITHPRPTACTASTPAPPLPLTCPSSPLPALPVPITPNPSATGGTTCCQGRTHGLGTAPAPMPQPALPFTPAWYAVPTLYPTTPTLTLPYFTFFPSYGQDPGCTQPAITPPTNCALGPHAQTHAALPHPLGHCPTPHPFGPLLPPPRMGLGLPHPSIVPSPAHYLPTQVITDLTSACLCFGGIGTGDLQPDPGTGQCQQTFTFLVCLPTPNIIGPGCVPMCPMPNLDLHGFTSPSPDMDCPVAVVLPFPQPASPSAHLFISGPTCSGRDPTPPAQLPLVFCHPMTLPRTLPFLPHPPPPDPTSTSAPPPCLPPPTGGGWGGT